MWIILQYVNLFLTIVEILRIKTLFALHAFKRVYACVGALCTSFRELKKFKCGKKVVLQDTPEGTRISGLRVKQYKDFSITYDMNEYAKNNMKLFDKPRGFYTHTQRKLMILLFLRWLPVEGISFRYVPPRSVFVAQSASAFDC